MYTHQSLCTTTFILDFKMLMCVCYGVHDILQHANPHCNTGAPRMQRIRVLRLCVCSGVRDTLQHAHTHRNTCAPRLQLIRDVLRLCVCSGVRDTLQHAHTYCNTSALRMQRIRDILRLMQRFAQYTHTHTRVTPTHT